MRVLLSFSLMLSILISPACGVMTGELTVLQADTLARLAFEHKVEHVRHHGGYSLNPQREDYDPGFAWFEVIGVWHRASQPGSAILGRFAVDRRTAKVWDTYAECFPVQFPALHKMQQRYLHAVGHSGRVRDLRSPRLC